MSAPEQVMRGVVLAWCCGPCRAGLGIASGEEYQPGRWCLGPMHIEHVPELVAQGWDIRTYAEDGPDSGPPDCICPHYAALCEAAEDDG